MKFVQHIKKEDMLYLNLYLQKQNKKITINIIITTLVALVGSIYCFISSNIILGIVFSVVALLAFFGIPFMFKKIIKSAINKRMAKNPEWDILVRVDDEGIYYAFENEDEKNIDPYIWGDISYTKSFKDYLIVQINVATYLIIKKADCPNIDELEDYFVRNLKTDIRYFKCYK